MDIIEIKILALKQLKEEIKKTEAYDGWSEEYMLEHFEKEHKYNPRKEYQYLSYELLEELFEESSKPFFEDKFYEIKKLELNKNIKAFEEFEKVIISNFNHFPIRVLLTITDFLLHTAANLNEV